MTVLGGSFENIYSPRLSGWMNVSGETRTQRLAMI